MSLTRKTNGYFVEINEYTTTVARTSSLSTPLVVEKIETAPTTGMAGVAPLFDSLAGERRGKSFRSAICGISPERRFIRRATLDTKKVKDPGYLEEYLTSQYRAEPDKLTLAILSPSEGTPINPTVLPVKDAMFCGSYTEDFSSTQESLLAAGIYPERLEITTIATLGAIMGGLALQDIKSPALVLEVGREQTSSYILSATGMDLARPIPHGLNSMIPVAQKEMGLKDEEAATKLLFSNTFDFTGMGPSLLKRLLKELQSSIGFYEVQTGQSIGYTYCSLLPGSFSWLPSTLATTLGVAPLEFDIAAWCKARDISFAPSVVEAGIQPSWLGVLGLMANHHPLSVRNEAK